MKTVLENIKVLLFILVFFMMFLNIMAQSEKGLSTAEGYVIDDKTDEPLPFVNVYFKGTTIGTTTNIDGKYKIKSRHHNDTLIFSMLGYREVKVFVESGNKYSMIIKLQEDSQNLEEVIIRPGENPSHPILRNIIRNKYKNDPQNLKQYNCQTYTAINASLTNFNEENLKLIIPSNLVNSFPVEIDSIGNKKLPIFLSEKISVNYIDKDNNIKQMQRLHSNSKALMGFGDIDAKGYTSSLSAEMNFYKNYLDLFGYKFLSPLANNGLSTYRYYLEDSTIVNGNTIYHIKFVPRRAKELSFNGYFEVVKGLWAITYIEADLPITANINFLNKFKISFTYDFVDDSVLFFKNNTIESSFHYLKNKEQDDKLMIEVDKVTLYSEIFLGENSSPLKELPEVKRKDVSSVSDDSTFVYYRNLSNLKSVDESAKSIDSTNNIPLVKGAGKLTNMFITGYFNVGKIDIGPYLGTFKTNNIEGNRIGLGLRTSEKFNPFYSVGGSLGYGFKDEEWKYSLYGEYKFNSDKRIILGGGFEKDLYLFGVFSHINLIKDNMVSTGEDSFIASVFKRYNSERRAMLYKYNVYLEKEWRVGLSTFLAYEYDELRQGVFVPFIHNGEPLEYIYNNSVSLRFRFSWEENLTDIYLRRYYFNTNYPVINVLGTAGVYSVAGVNSEYFKLHLTLKHNFSIGLTKMYYVFETGRIFGDVPFPLLNIVRGNDTYGNSRYRFNLLNNATAAMDTYASVMASYYFNGIIMNKIPLLRALNIRTLITAKYIVGSLSNKHEDVLVFPWDMYVPGNQYLEIGFGIENIFRLIRVDAIWRPLPEKYPEMPIYGIRVRLDLMM